MNDDLAHYQPTDPRLDAARHRLDALRRDLRTVGLMLRVRRHVQDLGINDPALNDAIADALRLRHDMEEAGTP